MARINADKEWSFALLNFKETQLRWKRIANERGNAIAEGDSQPKQILTADDVPM